MSDSTQRLMAGWQSSLLLTLLVAFALRLGIAVAVDRIVAQPPSRLCLISGDAEGYWELGHKIASGEDYALYTPPRFVLRMPGFPLVLAASQALLGPNPFATRCLLACIGTAACGLTYWLGRELADPVTALIATIYTALSPTLALFSVLFLSETAFAATLLASLIALARMAKRDERTSARNRIDGLALGAGILIGVATYMRPTWLYVGPALTAGILWLRKPHHALTSSSATGAWLTLGLVITMTPWVARNYAVTGHIVPTTLWVGPSLYDGLHPSATGESDMTFFEQDQLLSRMSEYEMDREYRRRAMKFAWEHPGRAAWLAIEKQRRYWSLFPNAAQFADVRLQTIVAISILPLLGLAIGGWRFADKDPFLRLLTAGPILLFAGLHLLFVGSLRYRLPAEFPLAILAGFGLKRLLKAWHCSPSPILRGAESSDEKPPAANAS